jgi:hypothetical protein
MVFYDPDRVEARNVPASFLRVDQQGMPKPLALTENIRYFMGELRATPVLGRFEGSLETPVCVVAVDSRETRIDLWDTVKDAELLIDLRSGKHLVHIYTFKRGEPGYLSTLQREGEELACSERAVAFNSFTVAGLCGGIVSAWASGERFPRHIVVDHFSWITITEGVSA